ncbi:hypothetical protein [Paenibacillus pasadenensis]|uniref:hypothetical protein n=1 Tax=Paenibacillus pasadenensis TaxID=217090 RepID=UPI00041659E9|nr:hypothetical protein [Paenibacillus pasadenensis]
MLGACSLVPRRASAIVAGLAAAGLLLGGCGAPALPLEGEPMAVAGAQPGAAGEPQAAAAQSGDGSLAAGGEVRGSEARGGANGSEAAAAPAAAGAAAAGSEAAGAGGEAAASGSSADASPNGGASAPGASAKPAASASPDAPSAASAAPAGTASKPSPHAAASGAPAAAPASAGAASASPAAPSSVPSFAPSQAPAMSASPTASPLRTAAPSPAVKPTVRQSLDGPATIRFSELYGKESVRGLAFSDKLKELDGMKVEMTGYMAPPLTATVRFFVLTRIPLAVCPFCSSDADWPSDIVVIQLPEGKELTPTEHQVKVTGTLSIGSQTDEETGFVSLIRIVADKTEVLS